MREGRDVRGKAVMGGEGDPRWGGRELAAAALLLLVGTAFLHEVAFLRGVPFARDMQLFFLPHRRILWDAFQAGRLPLWTPHLWTGYPVLANFQSGVLYPPHWLYAVLPFFAAFNFLLVFHVLLGGAGAYAACRVAGLSAPARWAGAAAFMLGGYFASLTNLINGLQAAAWAPWMIWSLLLFTRTPGPGRLALLVGVHALAFLAGEPQTFLFAAALSLGYALVRSRGTAHPRRAATSALLGMAGTAVLVAGLTAVQVLPTLEMVRESTRITGLDFEQAGSYSLAPIRLLHLVLPNLFLDPVYRFGRKLQLSEDEPWLFSVYVGVTVLVFAFHALRDPERRAEAWWWLLVALAGAVLALGRHTPVFPWLYQHVPGVSAFRFPEKFFFLTGLGAAFLCGHGVDAVGRRGPDRAAAWAAAIVLAVGAAAKLWWILGRDELYAWVREHLGHLPIADHLDFAYRSWGGNLDRVLIFLALAMLLVWLRRRNVVRRALFGFLACLLVALDLGSAHRHLTPVVERDFYSREPAVTRHLPPEDIRREFRYRGAAFDRDRVGLHFTFPGLAMEVEKWYWQETLQPSTGSLHGYLTHDSGDAIQLRYRFEQDALLRVLPDDLRWQLLRLGSVKYVFSALDHPGEFYDSRVRLDTVPGWLYTVRDPIPRAYVARGVPFNDEVEALNAALAEGFEARTSVAVLPPEGVTPARDAASSSERVPASPADTLPPGEARILEYTGEYVRVSVDAREPAFLVLTDTWYPGWEAVVDGEPRPLQRANYFFRAVPVEPGDREVVFRYRSLPFERGRRISAVTLVLFLAGVTGAALWRRRRRRP